MTQQVVRIAGIPTFEASASATLTIRRRWWRNPLFKAALALVARELLGFMLDPHRP